MTRTMPRLRGLLAAAALAACAACGFASTPTRHDALVAIAVLEKSVSSPEAVDAARTIVTYAQASDDVMVDIGPDQIPWSEEKWGLGDGRELACQSMMLASFIAGNVRSQIKNNRAEDDTYSGWVFAINTYNRLRAKERFRSPSLESLSKMESDGTLLQHAREVEARSSQQEEPQEQKPLA